MIAENGVLLAETARFQRDATLIVQDLDLQRLQNDRAVVIGDGRGLLMEEVLAGIGAPHLYLRHAADSLAAVGRTALLAA